MAIETWHSGPLWHRSESSDTTLLIMERVRSLYKTVTLASGSANTVQTIEHGLGRIPVGINIVNYNLASAPTHASWYRLDTDDAWTTTDLTARFLFDDGDVLLEIF